MIKSHWLYLLFVPRLTKDAIEFKHRTSKSSFLPHCHSKQDVEKSSVRPGAVFGETSKSEECYEWISITFLAFKSLRTVKADPGSALSPTH